MAAPPNGCVVSAEQVFETAEPVTDLPSATAGAPEVGAAGACHTHAGGMQVSLFQYLIWLADSHTIA